LKVQIAEFAWTVKNLVRPTGLHRLGFPCHLMGSGMAFPWSRIRSATLASGHIVEDLKLGIDMALVGAPPLFCPSGLITSEFPQSAEGIAGQRTRWEHGHLSVILSEAPRLFWKFLTSGDRGLLALALDLSVPPIALLTLLVTAALIASFLFFLITNAWTPIAIISFASALLVLSVAFSWMRYGRNIISFVNLAYALVYASMKIPLYARFLFAKQTTWIRSKRGGKNADTDSRPD
jgi:cellulose synthase/poly-beta-1,6-N-acetylglucosamine synthase-like glycosyltransferase